MFDFLKGIIIFITTITLPISGLFVTSKPVTKPTLIPTPTISISVSPTPKNSIPTSTKKNIDSLHTPTAIPTTEIQYIVVTSIPIPTPTSTSIPLSTQNTKIDSATHIELCKTKADTFKTQTMTALVLVYNQNNANAVKIANASSVDELVNVGISIGFITRDQYNSDSSGHQLALLKTREKVMAEIKSYMDTVNAKGDMAYNDYYAKCLNNENY